MFSVGEMEVLQCVSRGTRTVQMISEETGKDTSQTYRIVQSLRSKDVLILSDGKVSPSRKTHIVLLLDILGNSVYSATALGGIGIELLIEFRDPQSVKDVCNKIGRSKSAVSRKLSQMLSIGMLWKKGTKYTINDSLWPELRYLADECAAYIDTNDIRAPPGSLIYRSTEEYVLYSSNNKDGGCTTAFSNYGNYGLDFAAGTEYCISPGKNVTLREVFLHSLYILEKNDSWRLRMMALIFYVKHKDLINCADTEKNTIELIIGSSIKREMDAVLGGKRVKGWMPLAEMQERADMFGVVLR